MVVLGMILAVVAVSLVQVNSISNKMNWSK